MADAAEVQRFRALSHWSDLDESLKNTQLTTLRSALAEARQRARLGLPLHEGGVQSCFQVGRRLLRHIQLRLIRQLLDELFVRQIRHGSTFPETPLERELAIARLPFLFSLS